MPTAADFPGRAPERETSTCFCCCLFPLGATVVHKVGYHLFIHTKPVLSCTHTDFPGRVPERETSTCFCCCRFPLGATVVLRVDLLGCHLFIHTKPVLSCLFRTELEVNQFLQVTTELSLHQRSLWRCENRETQTGGSSLSNVEIRNY